MNTRNVGRSRPVANRKSLSGTGLGVRPFLGLVVARDVSQTTLKGSPLFAPSARTEFPFRIFALRQPIRSNAPEAWGGFPLAGGASRPPRRRLATRAEETFCQPVDGRAVGRYLHGFSTVFLGAAKGLFVGFGINPFQKHYGSGLVAAEDLGFVPVELQTGRAGDEPAVLDFFKREVAHFRGIVLRAEFDRAIAEKNVGWLRAG
jgi:hypothetical protein